MERKVCFSLKCNNIYLWPRLNWYEVYHVIGERGSVVGWGTTLQAGRSRVRFPMRSLDVFNWLNLSRRTVSLGSTQPLTEMSTRNLPGAYRAAGRRVMLTISQPSVNQLSRENVGSSTSYNPMCLQGLLQGQLYVFYIFHYHSMGRLKLALSGLPRKPETEFLVILLIVFLRQDLCCLYFDFVAYDTRQQNWLRT
jgi:hypothetical protein